MFKLRLIAAAVLASVMAPTVASANYHDDRLKLVVQTRNDIKENRDRIRALIKNHQGDAQDLKMRLAKLNLKLDDLNGRIKKLKEGSASA